MSPFACEQNEAFSGGTKALGRVSYRLHWIWSSSVVRQSKIALVRAKQVQSKVAAEVVGLKRFGQDV